MEQFNRSECWFYISLLRGHEGPKRHQRTTGCKHDPINTKLPALLYNNCMFRIYFRRYNENSGSKIKTDANEKFLHGEQTSFRWIQELVKYFFKFYVQLQKKCPSHAVRSFYFSTFRPVKRWNWNEFPSMPISRYFHLQIINFSPNRFALYRQWFWIITSWFNQSD